MSQASLGPSCSIYSVQSTFNASLSIFALALVIDLIGTSNGSLAWLYLVLGWSSSSRKELEHTFCCWVLDEKSILTPKHEKRKWYKRCWKENLCLIFPSRFMFDREIDRENVREEIRWGWRERMSGVVMVRFLILYI
jgi:hypothetical protein